jgi:hypothetical protein
MQLRTPLERAPSAAHLLSSSSKTASIKSVDTIVDDATVDSERHLSAIDRCLPAEVLTVDATSTLTAPRTVTIIVAGTKYLGLVDTGACSTCVDPLIPVTYGLTVTPVKGKVRMADVNVVASRIGTCTITAAIERDDSSLATFTHSFEVLPLFDRNKGYHFIIGRDLLYPVFHRGLSPSYFMPDSHVCLPSFDDPLLADIVTTIRAPVSHDASSSIAMNTLIIDDGSLDVTVTDTVAASISEDLEMLESHIHDTGAGDTPPDEHPVRPSLISSSSSTSTSSSDLFDLDSTTPDDIRREYSDKLSHLRKLLIVNESIGGFCTLPDSQVQLVVDESKLHLLYRRQYPIAHQLWSLADKVILRWLDTGKITHAPVGCPYNLPLTIAPKKDDSGGLTGIRVCLDTRVLNSILVNTDRFQIPNIRDTLEMFANCELFGEFDLSEAYLQFELHPDSRPYTAFTWNNVQYMFVGVPFGISFIPSHFQRCISRLFHDLSFLISYFDNLPFGSSNWSDHIDHAILIVHRLNSVNLRIKPSSVKIGRTQMKCLGHILSSRGIGIDPEKIELIRSYPLPVTGDQMMQFLGLTGFISSHVRHYAELTAPLQAVKFQKKLDWTDDMKHSFDTLKSAVATAPFLQYPDFSRAFHIATDGSNTGIGGVLYQPRTPGEHITADNIVAIHSRVLTETQRRYPAYKKELYGIVSSLRKFHAYVWGRSDLVIITDHKPLTFILSSTQLSPALQQWLDVLLDYSFVIHHRDGILHVLPDRLSRLYSDVYSSSSVWGIHPSPNHLTSIAGVDPDLIQSSLPPAKTNVDVSVVTRNQAFWQPVIPPSTSTSSSSSGSTSAAGSSSSSTSSTLSVIPPASTESPSVLLGEETANAVTNPDNPDNIEPTVIIGSPPDSPDPDPPLPTFIDPDMEDHRKGEIDLAIELEKRGKINIPDLEHRKAFIRDVHLQGHFGVSAVFNKIWHLGYWWPKIRNDIHEQLIDCDACIRHNVTKSGYHPFTPITAKGPGDHFQIDLSTHLPPSSDGYTTLLAVIDVWTGFVILRSLRNSEMETVARKLWKIFCLVGWPRILQSDNGPEFVNKILRALVKLTGLDHRFISPYNPRADGKVERVIGSTMMIIKKLLHGAKQNWSIYVPFAQVSFNDKITTLTGSSPFALMFGRSLNILRDYASDPVTPEDISLDDWKTHQEKILSLIYPAIDDRIKQSKDKLAQTLAKHRRMLLSDSVPNGATVMIKDPRRENKFEPKYIGPYIVVRRARNGAYVLKDTTGDLLDRHVPVDQLKIVSKRSRAKDADTYTVNKIIDHRGDPGSYEYLVDWKGFDKSYRSWEPESQFNDDRCITDYWQQRKASTKA